MPYTPTRRGSKRPWMSSPRSSPKALKGLFVDNVWHCNCEPRLPASHFQVRKDGANKGRWFYTCQEPKESGCGFFLWDSDASSREMRSVIANTRSESELKLRTTSDTASESQVNKMTIEGHKEASNKWLADLGNSGEDEFGAWPLLAGEDDVVSSQTTPTSSTASLHPSPNSSKTSQKFARSDPTMTPDNKRKREEDMLPTPDTSSTVDIFDPPSISRSLGGTARKLQFAPSPIVTPTPKRYRDAAIPALPETNDAPITKEILILLESYTLPTDTISKVRELINRFALKTAGIEKGRDMVRLSLKRRDAKNAELHLKIAALENEKEMDKRVIQSLKEAFEKSASR